MLQLIRSWVSQHLDLPEYYLKFLNAYTSCLIYVSSWLFVVGPRPNMPDSDDRPDGSCPQHPPPDGNQRTEFGRCGCTVYGYPSTGGVLMKEVDSVDMQFLQLDRFSVAQRTSSTVQEDEFCSRMRKLGATWWAYNQEWFEVEIGMRESTASECQQLIFGWPMNGEGVWFLRYDNERDLPKDFGKISLAINMDERCQVMKQYGAAFYADPNEINEWTHEL